MMNTHVVPCPACQTPLNVPPSAGGRRARCPACGDRFIIPTRTDLLEDTVSGWIEQDVSDVISDRDRESDESHASQVMAAIKDILQDRAIEDLDLPYGAVATDLQRGRTGWLREGC